MYTYDQFIDNWHFKGMQMLAEVTAEEISRSLDVCIEGLLWDAGVGSPPVDAFRVAHRLGVVVAEDATMCERARFVRLRGMTNGHATCDTIYVGPEPRSERRQWAVAHEIGESVAHRVFVALGVDGAAAPAEAREAIANQLATRLLLPTSWFAVDGFQCDWNLMELKRQYATASHELVARRMLEMRPPVAITLCDQGRVVWRRCNAGCTAATMSAVERALWQHTHRCGVASYELTDPLADGFLRVHCWPIHEPGWRREILRTEIASWD